MGRRKVVGGKPSERWDEGVWCPLSVVCVDMCVAMHGGGWGVSILPQCLVPDAVGGACCPPRSGLSTFAPIPSDGNEYWWENGSKTLAAEKLWLVPNCRLYFCLSILTIYACNLPPCWTNCTLHQNDIFDWQQQVEGTRAVGCGKYDSEVWKLA